MADIKAGSFSKVVQKKAGRAKERLLQNFGKADKTTDEIFDEYVNNFSKQQNAVLKLQKEVKNYHHCLKAMQTASKTLMETVCDLYEPNWVEFDKVQVKAQILDSQWEEFCSRLNDQVISPLTAYLVQFPEVATKISKRGRKLLDYDGCRHQLQSLEQNIKKREEVKITKAKDQLEEARNLYEVINTELHEELPALYDSRVSFFVSNLQCLFIAEAKFHTESSKLFIQLNDAMEALASENNKGTYSSRRLDSDQEKSTGAVPPDQDQQSDYQIKGNGKASKITSAKTEKLLKDEPAETPDPIDEPIQPVIQEGDQNQPKDIPDLTCGEELEAPAISSETSQANTSELPPGVLYKVRATYKYIAEDVDELSFQSGEIINVVEFDDPDEQEEGWLMGYKDDDTKRGLFPANFTRPI